MIKTRKTKHLRLARETLVVLSTQTLKQAQGGVETIANGKCEPSGIRPCPTQAGG